MHEQADFTNLDDPEFFKERRRVRERLERLPARHVDQEIALAVLEFAWTDAGYHGFGVDDGLWSAISSAGDVLTGDTPDALTDRIGAHWQAMQ
jgi:hypothetical protein